MGSNCTRKDQLPRVCFQDLDRLEPGTKTWASTRDQVAWALSNYGGFELVYDNTILHTLEKLFQSVMPELFVESNLNSPTLFNYDGLWIQRDSKMMPIKSHKVTNPRSLVAVQEAANSIWPHGNENFSDNIWNYAKKMEGLALIIQRMILESLGLEDYYDSHFQSLQYSLRLSEYYTKEQIHGSQVVIPPHVDPNFLSIICQQKKGLEVKTLNGEWVETTTMLNSFTVLLGEVFTAWTNGIFRAPRHRVKIEGDKKRYSIIFNTYPSFKEGMIETPSELVDETHPLLFNPFKYYDYIQFRHSEEGEKHKNILEAYCGVKPTKIAA